MSEELTALREFLLAYRAAYMDTQTHPTPAQEAKVMIKAEIATAAAQGISPDRWRAALEAA